MSDILIGADIPGSDPRLFIKSPVKPGMIIGPTKYPPEFHKLKFSKPFLGKCLQ
jgi:hypothetical protein